MRVRMKLVVPLTMPMTRLMRSPASDSRSGRMRGMAPHTAASNSRSTPDFTAASNSSAPWVASSSLLAVTTGLPASRAVRIRVRAGSMPPMTSTTRSMSGSATTPAASSVSTPGARSTGRGPGDVAAPPPGPPPGAGRCGRRWRRRCRRPAAPARRRRCRSPRRPIRTVELPSIGVNATGPALLVEAEQVVQGLPADDHPGRAVAGRTPPPAAAPCCSWTPWSGRRRR